MLWQRPGIPRLPQPAGENPYICSDVIGIAALPSLFTGWSWRKMVELGDGSTAARWRWLLSHQQPRGAPSSWPDLWLLHTFPSGPECGQSVKTYFEYPAGSVFGQTQTSPVQYKPEHCTQAALIPTSYCQWIAGIEGLAAIEISCNQVWICKDRFCQ